MESDSVQYSVIEEVAEMLVNRKLTASSASFRFSEAVQNRFDELNKREKMGLRLTGEERAEVEFLLAAHQMLNIAKIKSMQYATAQAA